MTLAQAWVWANTSRLRSRLRAHRVDDSEPSILEQLFDVEDLEAVITNRPLGP